MAAPPSDHYAAFKIQRLYRAKIHRRKTGAMAAFEKHLDIATGRCAVLPHVHVSLDTFVLFKMPHFG